MVSFPSQHTISVENITSYTEEKGSSSLWPACTWAAPMWECTEEQQLSNVPLTRIPQWKFWAQSKPLSLVATYLTSAASTMESRTWEEDLKRKKS